MKKASRNLVLTVLLGLGACASPIRTTHDSAPDVDFTRYATYVWIRQDPLIAPSAGVQQSNYVSPIDDRRIRSAVDDDLGAKGYLKRSDFEGADLVVTYSIGSKEKVQVRQEAGRSTVYTGGYGYGSWYGHSPVSVSTYTEGTLAIEFYDRSTRQAVWVGFAQKRLSRNDDHESVLKRAVTAILADFPARPE